VQVKEAVAHAKRHLLELYSDEGLSNVGLEEVEFDNRLDEWRVTIGFSRPWDDARGFAVLTTPSQRTYKVVRVSNADGPIRSVKNREAA
jgi:hypothetical protein